ncbi:MAG: twin transmembrane helix small protein [Rhodocyclaceae bacterium]|uniref:twin transmembrane helix small protein n=1 Tax=Uliginosibacterium sp. sgz301328 TaxID=3243764 RepID=UPI00359ED1A6
MRYVVIALLVAIFISLASGLVYLIRDKGEGTRTVRALTWRVGLSVVLFILVAVAYRMGWIHGHLLGR